MSAEDEERTTGGTRDGEAMGVLLTGGGQSGENASSSAVTYSAASRE
ncbi:hypothetical protein [Haladaptatus salinisoli]|nr:hypothetical protein [Haladaptatus salinisoli]